VSTEKMRVLVDLRHRDRALAVRSALLGDEYEVELVESASELQRAVEGARRSGPALVLTASPDSKSTGGDPFRNVFEALIPRPPLIAVAEASEARREAIAESVGLDSVVAFPPDRDEIRAVLKAESDRHRVQLETGIIGRTRSMRRMLHRVELIAPVNATVLLTGESGTGKEKVARAIHKLSSRRGRPFIPVNCAALPETLLESELFGHEKGAFTGASSMRRGMFELADGGTLLLDEIAEMPPSTQTRLLRILESRQFMRVGGDREITADVRVIAATNRDLARSQASGEFRSDLYYRLNVIRVEVPPLRERQEDVPVLMRCFVEMFSAEHDRSFKGLTPEATEILADYAWPGNVRELRNLVESMVVLAPGQLIRPEDIPEEIRFGPRLSAGGTLPALVSTGQTLPRRDAASDHPPDTRAQLEFVFKTLLDLKVDVDYLKREFEAYRARAGDHTRSAEDRLIDVAIAEVGDADSEGGGMSAGSASAPGPSPAASLADVQKAAVSAALAKTAGNRREAAELLQISERTLYRRIKAYGLGEVGDGPPASAEMLSRRSDTPEPVTEDVAKS